MYARRLNLPALLKRKSFFLFGPRSTGKSTLIRMQLPQVPVYDLLDSDVFARLTRRPKVLGEELPAGTDLVVIDEVQKLPTILDEVHRLIESRGIRFLMTGSSARKLRRGASNLLAGRAWRADLYPLVTAEIPGFRLEEYLNTGGLPPAYASPDAAELLKSYANMYLREEIVAEALTRKIEHFARFLDVMALSCGEELNYQGIASDAGVPPRTVAGYVEVLEDTLLGFCLPPFRKTTMRKAIGRSKFYFFDVGVTNALARRGKIEPKSELFGRAMEHFIIQEVRAWMSYTRSDLGMSYWRSTSGMEVDLILGCRLAVEIKSTDLVSEKHVKGLRALAEEGLIERFAVVSCDPTRRRMSSKIEVWPWQEFLREMWKGRLVPTA